MPEEKILTLSFLSALAVLPGLIWRRRLPTGGAGSFSRAGLAGLLAFLVWDMVTHGFEPITSAIELLRDEMDWDVPARWPPLPWCSSPASRWVSAFWSGRKPRCAAIILNSPASAIRDCRPAPERWPPPRWAARHRRLGLGPGASGRGRNR